MQVLDSVPRAKLELLELIDLDLLGRGQINLPTQAAEAGGELGLLKNELAELSLLGYVVVVLLSLLHLRGL